MASLDAEQLDEKIETLEYEEIDPADEEIAELVFNRSFGILNWDDLMSCTTVCHSWHSVVNGQLTSRTEFSELFKKKYPDEQVRAMPLTCKLLSFVLWEAGAARAPRSGVVGVLIS